MSALYSRRNGATRLSIFSLLVLFSVLSSAQNQPLVRAQGQSPDQKTASPAHRPRIGLALSGGGALGLAQIGVIQWLEENHIPVDRVAGTSMGGIIAARTATGMSPAEIRQVT